MVGPCNGAGSVLVSHAVLDRIQRQVVLTS